MIIQIYRPSVFLFGESNAKKGYIIDYNLTTPVASVKFNSHADGSSMVTVRHKANFASPDRWFEFSFWLQVGVRIALDYLKKRKKIP